MPAAKTLLDYLSGPSVSLPRRKSARKAVQAILRILEQPESNGGATYSLYFGDQFREPFFAVALDNQLTQRLYTPVNLRQAILDFFELNHGLLKHPRCCVGIWKGVNPDGSVIVFLDVTFLVYNEVVAYAFGVEGSQIAIFDLQKGVEIDTGGTGFLVPGSPPPLERLRRLEAQDRLELSEGASHEDGNAE